MLNTSYCNKSVGSCGIEQRTKDLLFLLMDLVAFSRLHTLGQLMGVVALSRVSSQVLKGVRAASHLDN